MIKGSVLRDSMISGANSIANQRSQIDELNVFPVPDGDTGTNMSMTIGAAKRDPVSYTHLALFGDKTKRTHPVRDESL